MFVRKCTWTSMGMAVMAIAVLGFMSSSVQAVTIYSDNFDGSSADLNGSAPDVAPGAETWVAGAWLNQDGSIDPAKGTATLAFTPADNYIYTLDASLTGVTGNGNWYALGFADGQDTSNTSRFTSTPVIGKAWMYLRGDASSSTNDVALGSSTTGTNTTASWSTYANQSGGDMDMRVVLDTSGGAGSWKATWYAKKPADGSYFQVGGPSTLDDETISSVGFASSNTGIDATIESFSLTAEAVPEPASLAMTLLGLSGLALLRRRG